MESGGGAGACLRQLCGQMGTQSRAPSLLCDPGEDMALSEYQFADTEKRGQSPKISLRSLSLISALLPMLLTG